MNKNYLVLIGCAISLILFLIFDYFVELTPVLEIISFIWLLIIILLSVKVIIKPFA